MNFVGKIMRAISDPDCRFFFLDSKCLFNNMSDEEYLRRKFRAIMGRPLNLDDPKTFNEKLQWLKLNDRKPEYTMMVDKYAAKKYVADIIGNEHIIPTLGIYDDPDEIDFDTLPDRFVLKCNHNSGLGMCICKDKSKLDISKVKKRLRKGLKQDYYLTQREWPYKNVPRKIIAETYMEDESSPELLDYKFMCFNGKVECTFVCSDRFSVNGLHVTFFDRNWQVMPFEMHYPHYSEGLPKPFNYDKMIELAEKLSENKTFVRVDFYEINKKIYFGELTFYPGSGFEEFTPEEWDYKLGDFLDLTAVKKGMQNEKL